MSDPRDIRETWNTCVEAHPLSLKISGPPRYTCPHHGEHDAVMTVRIYAPMTEAAAFPFKARDILLQRNYCMYCYVAHLDKARIQDMEPVAP